MSKKLKSTAFWHQNVAQEWERYGPPVRPSSSEIKIFEKFMRKKGKGRRVLVFGATPEMRDVAHKLKNQVTICDISFVIMMAMGEHMKYKAESKEETWVKADWLKAPLAHGY